MTVYLLFSCFPYEGCTFIGVFSSYEKAQKAKELEMEKYDDGTWYTWKIQEVEIDAYPG